MIKLCLFQSITLVEAEKMSLDILKQVMEEKISSTNVEIAVVRKPVDKRGGVSILSTEQIDEMLSQL